MTPHGNATGKVPRKYFRGKETSTIPLLRPPTREDFRGFNWAESTLPHSVLGMLLSVRMEPALRSVKMASGAIVHSLAMLRW